MDYTKFTKYITQIQTFSDTIHDEWHLVGNKDTQGGFYLIKTTQIPQLTKYNTIDIITCEYHIVYNISYRVPALCFNIWNSDGKLFTMENAWDMFNEQFSEENMFSVLTQMDHPVIQKPFLTLHPCKTEEILDIFMTKSENPVVSWLSTVAPAVNLILNPRYEELTRLETIKNS